MVKHGSRPCRENGNFRAQRFQGPPLRKRNKKDAASVAVEIGQSEGPTSSRKGLPVKATIDENEEVCLGDRSAIRKGSQKPFTKTTGELGFSMGGTTLEIQAGFPQQRRPQASAGPRLSGYDHAATAANSDGGGLPPDIIAILDTPADKALGRSEEKSFSRSTGPHDPEMGRGSTKVCPGPSRAWPPKGKGRAGHDLQRRHARRSATTRKARIFTKKNVLPQARRPEPKKQEEAPAGYPLVLVPRQPMARKTLAALAPRPKVKNAIQAPPVLANWITDVDKRRGAICSARVIVEPPLGAAHGPRASFATPSEFSDRKGSRPSDPETARLSGKPI